MTLDEITLADFSPLIGQSFLVALELPKALTLELIAASSLPPPPAAGKRASFRLLFRAGPEWNCPQQIYPLTHDQLGQLDIFLVPLAKTAEGTELEALFVFA